MATAAAALSGRARRMIQHHFFAADAVRPDRTTTFVPANGFERRQFERLQAAGAIRETAPSHYWLDLPAYDRTIRDRHRLVRLVLVALVVLLGALLVAGGFRPGF